MSLDASKYKDIKTSRGLSYHYYYTPAQDGKPTLLFLHGFPSTSQDWRRIAPFFESRGHGVVVPDLLGYGGTSKPLDVKEFAASKMSKDITDILDNENLAKVIVVGHDWGSWFTARLLNFYPERFAAAAFLAVGYRAPEPSDHAALNKRTKELLGYELFGYQVFFAEEGTNKIIENHFDTFYAVVFPHNPELWRTDMAPLGALKQSLLEDQFSQYATYLTEEDKAITKNALLQGGLASPLNWYKQAVSGLNNEDIKLIPENRSAINQPVFWGACAKDYICIPALNRPGTEQWCKNLTQKEYTSDHWVVLSHADEVNNDLLAWITDVVKVDHHSSGKL